MGDTAQGIAVHFTFYRGAKQLQQVAVKAGDSPAIVSFDDGSHAECGIYTDVVPGEPGAKEAWQEIELAKCNGKQVSTNSKVFVFGEPEEHYIDPDDSMELKREKHAANKRAKAEAITVSCIIIEPKLPKRPPHPDGRTCGECVFFNRARGIEELHEKTHQYANGHFEMTSEIVKLVCDQKAVPNIATDNVGHCPVVEGLCAIETPACDKFEHSEKDI